MRIPVSQNPAAKQKLLDILVQMFECITYHVRLSVFAVKYHFC